MLGVFFRTIASMFSPAFQPSTGEEAGTNSGSAGLYPDLHELIALKSRKAPLKLNAEHSIKSAVPGDHHSPFRGQGLEFDSVRAYVPGDDVRNIDWRVTARIGSPHLKLFKEERERQVIICVDMNEAMRFGTRNTFKSIQAARVAAFLGWRALDDRDRVGACLFGDVPKGIQYFDPKRTRKSLWAMFRMMAQPPKERCKISLEQALRHLHLAAHTGSLIYVISDFREVDEPLAEILMRLNKHCDVVCIAISDPADRTIMPVGRVGFQAGGGESFSIDTESDKGRMSYAAQWEENRQRLKTMTLRAKTAMVELTTEMEVHRELLLGLRAIARRRRR